MPLSTLARAMPARRPVNRPQVLHLEKSCQSRESRLHVVVDIVDGQPLSACRESSQKPFKGSGHTGSGIPNAATTGRAWCPRCWRCLPDDARTEWHALHFE
eukprot:1836488-Karenia_brevis.AAC.1